MNNLTISKNTISMNTVEIAEQTGKEHRNVIRDTKKMLAELYGEGGALKFERTYVDTQNKQRPCYALPKNEVLTLVSGYSTPLRFKIIRRWDELENRQTPPDYCQAKAHLDLELFTLDKLKCSESSKLIVTHSVYEEHGISTKYLPQYTCAVRTTFSAKDLLKKHGFGISSQAFNKFMVSSGFMEERQRTTSKGKVKRFKSLTEKGLKYGQNDASKQNPRETQPHYFENTFLELFGLITQ